jgi:hypothetical protein
MAGKEWTMIEKGKRDIILEHHRRTPFAANDSAEKTRHF